MRFIYFSMDNAVSWLRATRYEIDSLAFIESIMTALVYIDVLPHNLLENDQKLGLQETFHFQNDTDPKRSAKTTKEWLLYIVP